MRGTMFRGNLTASVRNVVTMLPVRFTVADVCTILERAHPRQVIPRNDVSAVLSGLVKTGVVRVVDHGRGTSFGTRLRVFETVGETQE